jgi:hypothetical protein
MMFETDEQGGVEQSSHQAQAFISCVGVFNERFLLPSKTSTQQQGNGREDQTSL